MDDKEFDKYIKDKLQESSQHTNADWEVMQKILVDEHIIQEPTDRGFDIAVKEQIDGVRAKFNASHWAILQQRLLTEKYLKKRLYAVKLIELCMLFMLCTTVITLVPFKSELYAVRKYRPTMEKLESLLDRSIGQVSSFFSTESLNEHAVAKSFADQTTLQNYPFITVDNAEFPSAITTSKRVEEHSNALSKDLDYFTLPQREVRADVIPLLNKRKEASRHIVSASVGLSANLIETPIKNSVGIRALEYTDVSRHVAMTYGVQTGRYEVFTGVGFYKTSYSPSISTGIFDSFQGEPIPLSEIDKISYSFIDLPLGLRYYFAKGDIWSLYGLASINLNVLALADYELDELSAVEKKLARLDPSAINQSNLRAGIDNDVSKGWLQGGSILDNLNTSMSIGLGICAKLDDRMSLFVQPSYTRSFALDGVGAQDENIDNLKIDLGFRLSI